MTAFTTFEGIAAPLMRINIDTDAIIPSREMKRVSKEGLAEGLFAGWRYLDAGGREPDPQFVLNQVPFNDASILVTGCNFGCGSSREHAVWALKEWGIRAIVSPSFGAIFASNCLRNGLLPICLTTDVVERIAAAVTKTPLKNMITVDLEQLYVAMGNARWAFNISQRDRYMLLRGSSPIAMTLESEHMIRKFEIDDKQARPWANDALEWSA